jgi:predicted dehydrogenase
MRFILSDNIQEVFASGISTMESYDVYDNISGNFITEKNALGTFNIGWKTAVDFDSIEIHGTGGSIMVNSKEIQKRHSAYGVYEHFIHHGHSIKKIVGSQFNQAVGLTSSENTYLEEDRAFIDAIRGQNNSIVSGEDGMRVLEVLDAIKTSIDRKTPVKINYHKEY